MMTKTTIKLYPQQIDNPVFDTKKKTKHDDAKSNTISMIAYHDSYILMHMYAARCSTNATYHRKIDLIIQFHWPHVKGKWLM